MRGMKALKVSMLSIFLIFHFLSGWATGGTVIKDSVLKPAAGQGKRSSSAFLHSSVNRRGIAPEAKVTSDLSIEQIYLKGCTIYVTIKNLGKGGISNESYTTGRLIVQVKEAKSAERAFTQATKEKKFVFSLKKVDPIGKLKRAQGRVDFDTKISCSSNVQIKAQLTGLKQDGKRGRKTLAQNITTPNFCRVIEKHRKKLASKEGASHTSEGFATRSATSRSPSYASSLPSETGKGGQLRQGLSVQDLEKARIMEEAEKVQKAQTLEEAEGQRAFEAERERRGRWQEREFEFSKDRKVNPKGGPVREEGLFGSEKPSFKDYRDLMSYMTGESAMRGLPGTPGAPRFGPRFAGAQKGKQKGFGPGSKGWEKTVVRTIKDFEIAFFVEDDPDVSLLWDELLTVYVADRFNINSADKAWRIAINLTGSGAFPDIGSVQAIKLPNGKQILPDKKDLVRFLNTYSRIRNYLCGKYNCAPIDPEKLGTRFQPFAPHRKHPVKLREEATDIKRKPHAVDVYHYVHEKKKKRAESSGGPQVNPGSTFDAGEIRHYNQGAETIWRLKTWATDPDFPAAQNKQTEQQERMGK